MAVDIEAISHLAKNYADDVRHVMAVDRAILFGSYANGQADEQSDIDICFFLNSFDGRSRVDVLKELLHLSRPYKGIFFEPIAFPSNEIEKGNPFVREILRTGKEI
jgi:predicted nucleotidyltransferase